MKKLLAIVLALTLVLSLGVTAFADDVKVAFSQIGQESDWRTANTDSIKSTIEGHDGWTLIYDDAQQKQENQIKALRNFITQGVDYILFTGVVETGWDEVLDNNKHNALPDNVIVQSWRGTEGGIKAASMNHKVIMSPCDSFYLNLKNKDSFEEPGRLGVTSSKKTYTFSPAGKKLKLQKEEQKDLILGGECAFWSEKTPFSRNAEYLIFPRFCAAAESLWLPEEKKDFEDFKERLELHKKLLHQLDFRFYEGELE